MVDILVRPPELRQISEQLKSSAKKIGTAMQAIDNDILSLKNDKFLGNRATAVQTHYAPKREALLKAKDMVAHFAGDLQIIAARFEQADHGQSNGGTVQSGNTVEGKPIPNNIPSQVLKFLDEWAKPIDWIGDNKNASKQFHELFRELGRVLNDLGDTRGYVSKMDGLAEIFEGGAKGISLIGNLGTLHDFQRFFSGETTNSEVLGPAISGALIWAPIPGLSDYITEKLLPYLPDPNGKWHGLVPEVQ